MTLSPFPPQHPVVTQSIHLDGAQRWDAHLESNIIQGSITVSVRSTTQRPSDVTPTPHPVDNQRQTNTMSPVSDDLKTHGHCYSTHNTQVSLHFANTEQQLICLSDMCLGSRRPTLLSLPPEVFNLVFCDIFDHRFAVHDADQRRQLTALLRTSRLLNSMVLTNSPFQSISLPISLHPHPRRMQRYLEFLVHHARSPLQLHVDLWFPTYLDITAHADELKEYRCSCLSALTRQAWRSLTLDTLGSIDQMVLFFRCLPNRSLANPSICQVRCGRPHTADSLDAFARLLPDSVAQLTLQLGDWLPVHSPTIRNLSHSLCSITSLILCSSPQAVLPILGRLPNLRNARVSLYGHHTCTSGQRRNHLEPLTLPHLDHLEVVVKSHCYCISFTKCNGFDVRNLFYNLHPYQLSTMTLQWRLSISLTDQGPVREGLQAILTRTSPSLRHLTFYFTDDSGIDQSKLNAMVTQCGVDRSVILICKG
jgi:hypothetical protein